MKRVIFRAVPESENTFLVSLPFGTRLAVLERIFAANLLSLKKLSQKSKAIPFTDKTYLFGVNLPLDDIKNKLNLKVIPTSLEDYYRTTKKVLLTHLQARVHYYSVLMKIPVTYRVRIRSMKTRWGSNSHQTMSLSFNEKLIHYHHDIIDSLVVHELAHYFIKGHGADFYHYVESIFPNYKVVDQMLKEHNYAGHH